MNTSLDSITAEMLISDAVAAHPLARAVIEKHFGGACFTCPGIKMESIAFGAMMHGLDATIIVQELRDLPEVE